jgi:hypothetical protein
LTPLVGHVTFLHVTMSRHMDGAAGVVDRALGRPAATRRVAIPTRRRA